MKRSFVNIFTAFARSVFALSLVLTLVVTPALALGNLQTQPPPTVLEIILSVILQFAQLAGVGAAIAAIIGILKTFKVIQDGDAGKWFAGFNLVAIAILVYLKLFQPQIAIEIVDAQAAIFAEILLLIAGYVVQLGAGRFAHTLFAELRLPLIGKSFSREQASRATEF